MIRFRPNTWLAASFLALAAFFGSLWYFALDLFAPIDLTCVRAEGQVQCEVVTHTWPSPAVLRLTSENLRYATLEVEPEPHDDSFERVELANDFSSRPLTEFTSDVRAAAVDQVNEFLASADDGTFSRRIVETQLPLNQRLGLLLIQSLCVVTFVFAVRSQLQVSRISVVEGELLARLSRWPLAPEVHSVALSEIERVEVTSSISKELAPVVASLPWRNIYRTNALTIVKRRGPSLQLTPSCKRSRASHERVATQLRALLNRTQTGEG